MSQGPYLLASDLDGTLIPPAGAEDDGGISEFRDAVERRDDLRVTYVTGRNHTLALMGIAAHALPAPDVLVCDVGTSVFVLQHGVYLPDPGYRERMAAAWGSADRSAVLRSLANIPSLELQEAYKQSEFKLSYYTAPGPEGEDVARQLMASIEEGVGAASVIYSVDPRTERGLLDVLPPGVAKDVAVRYLHDQLGLDEDRTVYAGDSGNDRAAMLGGFDVIVVGNATPALKDSIRTEAEDRGLTTHLYFARAEYARGVLEGCRYFGIF
jgi:HAD superfamily hydrolase (TIGR01484 family)